MAGSAPPALRYHPLPSPPMLVHGSVVLRPPLMRYWPPFPPSLIHGKGAQNSWLCDSTPSHPTYCSLMSRCAPRSLLYEYIPSHPLQCASMAWRAPSPLLFTSTPSYPHELVPMAYIVSAFPHVCLLQLLIPSFHSVFWFCIIPR